MKKAIQRNLSLLLVIVNFHLASGQNLVVSGGALHSAMLCGDGSVYVTGSNNNGQLGNGTPQTPAYSTSFVKVLKGGGPSTDGTYLGRIRQIDARSTNHIISLDCDSNVYVWGMNNAGQVGNGTTTSNSSAPYGIGLPTQVATGAQGHASGFLKHVIQICGGNASSYALLKTGELLAWGDNSTGELGDGTTTNRSTPVYVTKAGGGRLTNVIQVRGGDNFCAALCADGTVWTWGNNSNGQLGQNNTTNLSVATQVFMDVAKTIPLTGITKISTGDTHVMALTSSGTIYSWGGNWSGQLGVNTGGANAVRPALVVTSSGGASLTGVISISAGNQHSIAVCSNGNVYSWGGTMNYQGQDALVAAQSYPTTSVSGIANAVDVSAGDLWSFVQTSTGSLYAFGQNATTGGSATYGFLGLGTTTTSYNTPQLVSPPCGLGRVCPKANLGPNITICNPMSALLNAGASNSNYVYLWKHDGDTIITATSSTYTAVSPGVYTVIISDPANPSPCGCAPDSSKMTITSASNATAINPTYCTLPANLNFCVSGPSGTNYDWYNAASGGVKLNVTPSNCYAATVNSVPYIVYAQDRSSYNYTTGYSVGQAGMTTTSEWGLNSTAQQVFDVLSPITINQVTFNYTSVPGGPCCCSNPSFPFTVQVQTSAGVLVPGCSYTTNLSCTPGIVTLNLNFTVPVGTSYRMLITSTGLNVSDFSAGPSYPFGVSGIINFTGTVANTTTYAPFYDWQISAGNNCARVPVQAEYSCVLPVELQNFYGEAYNSYNLLSWTTSVEKDNNYFLVLKSIDGINFYTIGKVSGRGTRSQMSEYTFKDERQTEGISYYKIQQVDFNGQSTDSKVILIDPALESGAKVYPNPFEEHIKLYVKTNHQQEITVTVADITGRILNSSMYQSNEEISIGEELIEGIYFVQVMYEDAIEVFKVVKRGN